ncbi:MAG: cell division protein ZapE [Proteobacteria bacterium]|nr:cell division protein ZapE [Pseudomonadota bacterium]
MPKRLVQQFHARVAQGELKADAIQERAAHLLQTLAAQLFHYKLGKRRFFFGAKPAPRGLYIWGDVGRGKSMLMDLFFEAVHVAKKRRVHFNAFMVQTHGRIHEERQKGQTDDPIPPVAKRIAQEAALLCFDEFQVADVADAMILGRLFQQLFELGVVIVATSNTAPDRLYEGGLNRQLFLPFIAMIKNRLNVFELNGSQDYRLQRIAGLNIYITPLGPPADRAMEAAWLTLTEPEKGTPASLNVLGRKLQIPQAANGVARFSFDDLCARPLAAADYLAVARAYHTLLIDRIPILRAEKRDEARRFIVLIDTLYDEGVKLICSAEARPEKLYIQGDGADAFRRTASRLIEMQSLEYLKRGHGVHGPRPVTV